MQQSLQGPLWQPINLLKTIHPPFKQLTCMHLVLYVLMHTPAELSFVEYVHCNFLIAMNTFTFERNLSMKIRCHKLFFFFESKLWLCASRKWLPKQVLIRFRWDSTLACHCEIANLMLTSLSEEEPEFPFFLPWQKILS